MGSDQPQIPQFCYNSPIEQVVTDKQKKIIPHTRNSTSSNSESKAQIPLDEFIGKLTIDQCYYVLAQLLKQSFQVLQLKGKVVICNEICTVNSWGQIRIDWTIPEKGNRNYDPYICANLAHIITRIMQMAKELSIQQTWQECLEKSRILGKMMKIMYQQHKKSQKQLFKELMEDILLFMEANCFKCNLLPAILRLRQNSKEQSIFLGHPKTVKSVHQQVLRGFRKKKSVLSFNNEIICKDNYSKMDNSTKFQSTFEGVSKNNKRKHHKISKTQGENYFDFNLNLELQNSCIREQKVTKRHKNISKNHISCQFSLNILSSKPKDEIQSKLKVRFKDSIEENLQRKEKEIKIQKTNTAENLSVKQRRGKHQRSNAKSVLQQLARSVEVVDHPSSKSLIF